MIAGMASSGTTSVDCILRGVQRTELPVVLPTRREPIPNLNVLADPGLCVPPPLLADAKEVLD